jgi:hypothetical protein
VSRKISRRKFILSAITSATSVAVAGCATAPAPPTGPIKQPTTPPTLTKNDKIIDITPTASSSAGPTPADEINSDQILAALEDPDLAAVINVLREKFNYLYLSETDLVIFAQELKKNAGQKLLKQREDNPTQFRYEVCTQFLMSTDFFFNNADETRPVKYMAYYDRYRGCASPFARFD